MVWIDPIALIFILIMYFKTNNLGKKSSLFLGIGYSFIKIVICFFIDKIELLPIYIAIILLCIFFLVKLLKNSSSFKTNTYLCIGQCTVSGSQKEFEICITTNDGKQFKFYAEGDKITKYIKNGKSERYV